MNQFKITFSNGDWLITGFNGTLEEVKNYYLKNWFELDELKPMVKGTKVEQI